LPFFPAAASLRKRTITSSDVTCGTFPSSFVTTRGRGTGFSSVPKPWPNDRDSDDRAEREGAGEATRSKSFDRRGFLTPSSSSASREDARLRLVGRVSEEGKEAEGGGLLGGRDSGDEVRGALRD